MSMSTRARPLPPDERRAALVAAALPLVREHGLSVTTRQLAEASGVAEGTIFRVFPDKEALVCATVDAATDPQVVIAALARIDPELGLRERMIALTTVLQAWLRDVITLMMAVRHQGKHGPRGDGGDQRRNENNSKITDAVTELIEPDADALRLPVADVVRMLRALVFAGSHPMFAQGGPITPQEIVDVLLDGALVRTSPC